MKQGRMRNEIVYPLHKNMLVATPLEVHGNRVLVQKVRESWGRTPREKGNDSPAEDRDKLRGYAEALLRRFWLFPRYVRRMLVPSSEDGVLWSCLNHLLKRT